MLDVITDCIRRDVRVAIFTEGQTTLPLGGQVTGKFVSTSGRTVAKFKRESGGQILWLSIPHIARIEENPR